MVVARYYQILLPKNDFWPFSHWNSHWSPKILRTAEGVVVEQKQKQFWNQWKKWNNLQVCTSQKKKKFRIRITLPNGQCPNAFGIFFGAASLRALVLLVVEHILFARASSSQSTTDPNRILRNFPLKSEMKILSQKAKPRNGVSELIAIISCWVCTWPLFHCCSQVQLENWMQKLFLPLFIISSISEICIRGKFKS